MNFETTKDALHKEIWNKVIHSIRTKHIIFTDTITHPMARPIAATINENVKDILRQSLLEYLLTYRGRTR